MDNTTKITYNNNNNNITITKIKKIQKQICENSENHEYSKI